MWSFKNRIGMFDLESNPIFSIALNYKILNKYLLSLIYVQFAVSLDNFFFKILVFEKTEYKFLKCR